MRYRYALIILLTTAFSYTGKAQGYLSKTVTIEAKQKPLEAVLDNISKQTGAVFSYNSSILRKDSLVSLFIKDKSVNHILQLLFGNRISYKEKDQYIILQSGNDPRFWYVSGYVKDEATGERISNASVYEPKQLVATLTNAEGYFKIRFKGDDPSMNINVSKLAYSDVSFRIKPGHDQEVTIHILPTDYALDTITVRNKTRIEDTRLGRMFLSSKQKLQSVNVGKFFVDKPYQASLVPALGTHGSMSSQVVNKVSLNILGGYNAGVNGVEIGGILNLIKNDVKGAQIGGVYNMVGKDVDGVQASGISNTVFNNVEGVQIAGIHNHVVGSVNALQISGVSNFVDSNMNGWQIAGVLNYVNKKADGVQISGVANIAIKEVNGLQLSGVFNYTKKLKGVQIGVVNICDTSEGYSIGLINISRNGYHKLSIYNTDVAHYNAALKTGNKNIYTILFSGMNMGTQQQSWTFGGGLGADYFLGKKISLSPELTVQHLYLGDWQHYNILNRASLHLNYHINKYITVFGGPAYNIYTSDQTIFKQGYRTPLPENGVQKLGADTNGWLGWNVGASFF